MHAIIIHDNGKLREVRKSQLSEVEIVDLSQLDMHGKRNLPSTLARYPITFQIEGKNAPTVKQTWQRMIVTRLHHNNVGPSWYKVRFPLRNEEAEITYHKGSIHVILGDLSHLSDSQFAHLRAIINPLNKPPEGFHEEQGVLVDNDPSENSSSKDA